MPASRTILGLESSCDDTAAAVLRGDGAGADILSSVVAGQGDIHAAFGGVVPELAARAHAEKLDLTVEAALERAGVALQAIDAVAVTAGPGLIGGLLAGVMAAKGLGGGYPLGALLATETAARGMTAGTHGSTFGGNPLACAVGKAVMTEIAHDGFLDEVNRKSGLLRQRLEGLVAAHPGVFKDVRGHGLMLGLTCEIPNLDVVGAAHDANLLTVPAGDNVVRILPALTIGDAEIGEGVARLDAAATALEAPIAAA